MKDLGTGRGVERYYLSLKDAKMSGEIFEMKILGHMEYVCMDNEICYKSLLQRIQSKNQKQILYGLFFEKEIQNEKRNVLT